MLRMFAIVHAQPHSGTKGKVVRDTNGNVMGYRKSTGSGTVTTPTKKYQRAVNRGGNTGTGGTTRG